MKTEDTNPLDMYKDQITAMRETTEAFFEGSARIETLLVEQTRKLLDDQMKFVQATAAIRDPQGLAALYTAFFARTPDDLIKVQQQIVGAISDTQARIGETMNKHMNALKADTRPFGLANSTEALTNAPETLYSAWQKALQTAMNVTKGEMQNYASLFPRAESSIDDKKADGPAKGKAAGR